MRRVLLLTASELTRDPRARRQVTAARRLGLDPIGVSGRASGEAPAPIDGVPVVRVGPRGRVHSSRDLEGQARRRHPVVRELRGVARLARLAARSIVLARAAPRTEVVHANDLDTLPAAFAAARRNGARLVYDAHELYAEFEADPPRLYRAATRRVEGALARRCDAVVTVSDALADELERRLALTSRPYVVLNAPERSATDPQPHDGPLRAAYTGVLGSGRPLSDLLDGFTGVDGARLTVFALHQPADVLRRRVGDQADVAEPLPPDRVVAALGAFDVGVVFDRPVTRNAELAVPNKLFEYLMAGLAVVAPRLPGLAALVEGEGVGMLFAPGRPDDMRRTIAELARDRDRVEAFRRRARLVAVEKFNAEAQDPALARAWGIA